MKKETGGGKEKMKDEKEDREVEGKRKKLPEREGRWRGKEGDK